MIDTYTTYGPTCGDCGHAHETKTEARQCCDRHHRQCRARGGYSDRDVYQESEVDRNAVGDVYAVLF